MRDAAAVSGKRTMPWNKRLPTAWQSTIEEFRREYRKDNQGVSYQGAARAINATLRKHGIPTVTTQTVRKWLASDD